MNKELEAILLAMEENDDQPGNIDKARKLSTAYVKAHPDEFVGYAAWGYGDTGIKMTVQAVEVFREAYRVSGNPDDREQMARAEAWHFHTFDPQNIGGTIQPAVRNVLQGG